jgi:hypothetical protein
MMPHEFPPWETGSDSALDMLVRALERLNGAGIHDE